MSRYLGPGRNNNFVLQGIHILIVIYPSGVVLECTPVSESIYHHDCICALEYIHIFLVISIVFSLYRTRALCVCVWGGGGGGLDRKMQMPSYWYRNSHVKDKTVFPIPGKDCLYIESGPRFPYHGSIPL